jgi:Flp pilus assembly protein TadG
MRGERGSAMVEFALVVPLLVLLLLGIMTAGVLINSKIVVAGAAREAGRTWAILQDDGAARAKATAAVAAGGLKFYHNNLTLFDPENDVRFARRGDYVEVTVFYRQPTFVPLMARIIDSESPDDGHVTLRSQVMFRVER